MFLYLSSLFPSLLNGILVSLCSHSVSVGVTSEFDETTRVKYWTYHVQWGHSFFSPVPHHVFLFSAGCKVCVNKCVSWTCGTGRGELSLALSVTTLSQRMNHLQLTPGICKGLFHGSPNLFSSVTQSCPTLCDHMNHSTPGLPVHHQIPKFTQTHVHRVGDAIQPSHPLSSPSPPAPNPSQHQGLFQWVNISHEVAKVLEFQL